jgi:GDSL-like Lipase/Acylhydrolase family
VTRIRGWLFAVSSVAVVCATGLIGGSADATSPPTVAIIGDSFTAGMGSDCGCQTQAWFQTTARDLGWKVGNVVADPGAAFQNPGVYGTLAQAVAAHPIPASTDYVIVQGGLDDTLLNPAGEAAAVHHTLNVVHAQAPRAVVIVVGAFFPFPDHLDSPNQIPVARRIGDATAIGSARYVAPFLCEFPVTSDGVHPTTAGHRMIGDWIAWHLAHAPTAGDRLVWRPDRGYWTA